MTEKKPNYSIVIFSAGFFSLLMQTLLFRDFLAVFQGNEISTGLFFFSWLLWIMIGAFLGWLPWLNRKAVKVYEFLLLLYIPAYFLQTSLLFNARTLVGTSEYELIPFWRLAGTLTLFNSPISLITGFLFVAGAEWIKNTELPTGRVYVLDALGSFAGALAVTLLLYAGVYDKSVFFASALLPGIVPFLHNHHKRISKSRKYAIAGASLISLVFAVFLVLGFGAARHDSSARKQWDRMLPGGKFQGSFNTPQAGYYYGSYRGEFSVVRWNSICESLPNREAAWTTAAENLAEKPDARHILVIGSGAFALCRNFCQIPEIERVVWLDADPDYPSALLKIVPGEYCERMNKLSTPKQDVRAYLKNTGNKFDLIINLIPAPAALSLNRYYSADFYRLLRKALMGGGVLSVGFPGGENFMGTELKMIGASLLKTLREQFEYIILKPGASSRFFASDSDVLTIKPEILAKRLSGIKTLVQNFPPQNIYTLFDPFRAKFQNEIYLETIKSRKGQLINSDDQPVTSRFAILLALKKSGFGAVLPDAGTMPAGMFRWIVWGIIVLTAVRLVLRSITRAVKTGTPRFCDCRMSGVDIMFFVWITSVMAMSANILLIYAFQVSSGSIFLYFGLVGALFMLGLFTGGQISSIFFSGKQGYFFPLFSLLLIILLGIFRFSGLRFANIFLLGLAFLATGAVCGLWLPRAAAVLQFRGWRGRNIAWQLWLFDSLGGALGGLLCAVLLLPLFGALRTLDILLVTGAALLLLSLFPGGWLKQAIKSLLIPLIITCLPASRIVAGDMIETQAAALKPGEATLIPQAATFDGKPFIYYKVKGPGKKYGYIFNSAGLIKDIKGYGGEISVLLYTDAKGNLLNFTVLKQHETAELFNKVKARKGELLKKNIFESKTAFKNDGVTGATYTSKALVKTLNTAGEMFRALLSGKKNAKKTAKETALPPPGRARNIDAEKYRKLISLKELSNHKAMHFKKDQ
jgi:spermidine synthase